MTCPLTPIGKVIDKVISWDPSKSPSNYLFPYIDISSIGRDTKRIEGVIQHWTYDAPSRARQIVKAGDILVSTVRPNLNAVAQVPLELDNATASTGFCVLRPDQKKLDGGYLYYWVRNPLFVSAMVKRATGANYPAVSDTIVKESCLPLPPLPEQRRIATILDKAFTIQRKHQRVIERMEDFLRSMFLDMFGDPMTNPKGWKICKLHELCEEIVDCPHSTPQYTTTETSYFCIRSSDIQNSYLDWSTTKCVDASEYSKRVLRTVPKEEDVIYCREGARFGNAARVIDHQKICLGQRMMLLRAKRDIATSEFIWAFLIQESTYQQAVRISGGSVSPHVNVQDIKRFSTIIPPKHIQERFSKVVKAVDSTRERFLKNARTLDHLFNSLIQCAFRGELTSSAANEILQQAVTG